jgi:hypothetical protein
MRRMSRLRLELGLVFLLAALLSSQPVVHHHGLVPESGAAPPIVCSICAFGADHATVRPPVLTAPPVASWTFPAPAVESMAAVSVPTRSSRGPPSRS